MSYYIELCNNQVKIVNAQLRHDGSITVDAARTIFTVFDADAMENVSREIKDMGGKTDKAQLIVNNNAVLYKELRVPKLDRKQTAKVVENEMLSVQNSRQSQVSTWIGLHEKPDAEGLTRILGCALPTDRLNEYESLFAAIGCKKPRGIDVGSHTLMEYIRGSELADETAPYIVAEVSTGICRTFLFDQGSFIMNRSARVATDDTNQLIQTIREQVSLMQQFQSTRRTDARAVNAYLFGDLNGMEYLIQNCTVDDDVTDYEALPPLTDITGPADFSYLAYVYILGSVAGNYRDVNFLETQKNLKKEAHAISADTKKTLWIGAACMIPLAAAAFWLVAQNAAVQKQVADEEAYISDPARVAKVQKIQEQQSQISLYNEISGQLEAAQYINDTYLPTAASGLVQPFYGFKGVQVDGLSFDSSKMTAECSTNNIDSPYAYVNYLQGTGRYQKIVYNGFTKNDAADTETGDGRLAYVFTVSAELYRNSPALSTQGDSILGDFAIPDTGVQEK